MLPTTPPPGPMTHVCCMVHYLVLHGGQTTGFWLPGGLKSRGGVSRWGGGCPDFIALGLMKLGPILTHVAWCIAYIACSVCSEFSASWFASLLASRPVWARPTSLARPQEPVPHTCRVVQNGGVACCHLTRRGSVLGLRCSGSSPWSSSRHLLLHLGH